MTYVLATAVPVSRILHIVFDIRAVNLMRSGVWMNGVSTHPTLFVLTP